MMVKIFLSTLLVFLAGCGTTDTLTISNEQNDITTAPAVEESRPSQEDQSGTSETDVNKRVQIDTLHVVAGDDQQVIEGSSVVLYASDVDKESNIVSYTWKEGDVILATQKEVTLDTLETGTHRIVLEAVAEDGEVFSDVVTIEVKPPMQNNYLPKANDLLFTTPEDTVFNGALRGSDEDGDFLKYLLVSLPEHGTLSGSPAHLHYTPDPDFFGEDKFYFKTNDGKIDSPLATVTIYVEPRNDAPQIKELHESIFEDEKLQITLQGYDTEGDPLTFMITSLPKYGDVVIDGNQLVYTPQKGFSGRERFSYKANDGVTDSTEANITIDVNHVNHAPMGVPISVETNEDEEIVITLQGEDSDVEDNLQYRIVTPAVLGSVRIVDEKLYYTPFPNQNGVETLQYVVSDGYMESEPAEISITLRAVNDTPEIDAFSMQTEEDIAKTVTLSVNDPDGDMVTFHISRQPEHGVVSIIQDQLTYIPELNYSGSDSFSYYADDALSQSSAKEVSVTIIGVNDLPSASDLSYSVQEGESVDIFLSGSDIDSTTLTYLHEDPQHGILTGSGNALVYTPEDGFVGTDSFAYWVNDGIGDSEHKNVYITVTEQPNSVPSVGNETVVLLEDESKEFTLTGTDSDNDPLTFSIVDIPLHGRLSVSGSTVRYTPENDFFGDDSFSYIANDGKADSNIGIVYLNVEPVNDTPVALAQTINVIEDTPYNFMLQAEDIENDILTYQLDVLPSHGTLLCNNASCTYTPDTDFNGIDQVSFYVSDGQVNSSSAVINIVVNGQNDAPLAISKAYTLQEDSNVSFTLQASDADNDPLQYLIVTQPLHGTVQINGNSATYQPEINYSGDDRFSFKVNDGTSDSNVADINFTVESQNDLPVVQNSSVTLEEDTSKEITLSGFDIDGDTLTFEITQQPANGILSGTAPNLTYIPDANFNGSDSFNYIAKDSIGASNEATVSISVTSVNDIPVADAGNSIVAPEGVMVTLSAVNSYDPDGTIVSYEWIEGTTSISTSPEFTYMFSAGTHTVTLLVTDDSGATASDTVDVTIETAPQVSFTKLSAISPGSQEITALFTEDIDMDGDLDIVYAMGTSSQEIGWYRNNGNLSFTFMNPIVQGVSAQVVAMGDINSDNYPDLVYGTDALTICINDHTGNFTCQSDLLYGGIINDDNMQAITIADVDGVNGNDIIVSVSAKNEYNIIAYKQESGTFDRSNVMTIDSYITDVTSISVKDNDNDGDNDLLVSTSTSGVYYYQNNTGVFSRSALHNSNSTFVYFADIDHDQKYDALSIQGDVQSLQWDFLSGSVLIDPFEDSTRIDIDQDGFSDAVPTFYGTQSVTWYRNSGDINDITFTPQIIDTYSDNEIRVVKTIDMDNDGDTDLDIVVGTKSGEIFIYRNDLQ